MSMLTIAEKDGPLTLSGAIDYRVRKQSIFPRYQPQILHCSET